MKDIISKKNIGDRLRSLRLARDLSQAEVSEAFGLSRSHYSQVELGKQFPSYAVLSRIADFYHTDYEWILHGQDVVSPIADGKSVLDAEKKADISTVTNPATSQVTRVLQTGSASKTVLLKLTEQFAYLENRTDENYIAGLPELSFPLSQLSQGTYRAFEVEGDSMESFLDYQDIAIGRKVEDYTRISLSNVYVIVLDQCIRIRRITNFVRESRTFVCFPDNRYYRPETILVSDIKELWEVKAKISFKLTKTIQNISQDFQDFEKSINELKEELQKVKSQK